MRLQSVVQTKQKQVVSTLCMDWDAKCIPFEDVKKLMELWPYGDRRRVCILWLALTGARVSEIENRKLSEIIGKYWIWTPRKKQKGYRKEKLPDWFWNEFIFYLDHKYVKLNNIFGVKGESLSRQINKNRHILGGNWLKQRIEPQKNGKHRMVYIYQLKSLRHNFQTLEHYRNMEKYGGDVALALISRRMKHSTTHLTASHYIENYDALNVDKFKGKSMDQIIKNPGQTKIIEWF